MSVSTPAIRALEEWGAGAIAHPGGTLLDHLVRTEALLRSWDAPDELALAGLCHAAYGTDGFSPTLLSLEERPVLVELIGVEAEALVFQYASCDRTYLYPQLGLSANVCFRDRFDETCCKSPSASLRGFVELTFANEVDIIRQNPVCAAQITAQIAPVFRRCRRLVSVWAYGAFEELLDQPLSPSPGA